MAKQKKKVDPRWKEAWAGGPRWAGFIVAPVFFLVAAWFIAGPDLADVPDAPTADFDRECLSTTPRRVILGDPPTLDIAGFDRTCMDCHRFIPAADEAPDELMQHEHIVLNHGLNELCRNCHFAGHRDMLALRDGSSIPYSDVVRLCAQCHGPTYRDWERGSHGRTNGHWDQEHGPQQRLGCTECHEPHNPRYPAMDPMQPLPPPNTFRMGVPTEHARQEGDESDPLRSALFQLKPKPSHGEGDQEGDH